MEMAASFTVINPRAACLSGRVGAQLRPCCLSFRISNQCLRCTVGMDGGDGTDTDDVHSDLNTHLVDVLVHT